MNKVELVGRLTKDPEISYTTGENSIARLRFTVAVNRPFKNKDGNYDADFISCVAFNKTSEFISKYFHKGDLIGIIGNIRTGSYDKDGQRVYTTDVFVDNVEFVGGKSNNESNDSAPSTDQGFMNIPETGDEAPLPFL